MIFKVYCNKIQHLEKGLPFVFCFLISVHFESILLYLHRRKKQQKMIDLVKWMINLHLRCVLLTIFEHNIKVR